MGFFSSLFGQKSPPAARPPAPARADAPPAPAAAAPLGSAVFGTTEPVGAPIPLAPTTLDVPAQLDEARALLDNKDLPAALQIYEQIAAAEGDLAEPFARISGDLGATGHIDALIDFLAPRYEPALHGLPPGINLLQAYLHRRNPVAAQELLDLLVPLVTTYSMRDRLDGFRCAILELRATAPAETPVAPAAADINLINISKPVWTYGLEQGENLLPTKNHRVRHLAVAPFALVVEGLTEGKMAPADHPLAPLTRGLPFALAEACWFAPAYRPVALTGLDPEKDLLRLPRAFRAEQISQLFPKKEEPIDYAISGTVHASAAGALAAVELTIWDIRKHKLLKSLRFDGADAVARAWPTLLGYIEAAKPGPAPLEYALPADPAAHAVALDHVLHFFLVEKNVLPPERLAPHEPRLAALADYATAHADVPVPRLLLFAALRHCQALGLAVPPEIAAAAERLAH
ncbi:MAG: hypothetical protein QM691_12700 [Opitutaceae bacterium]